jgi:hypothetical protein
MTLSLTAFGVWLVPLVVGFIFFRRQWLWPLLVVSAVLQAPSVINIGLGQGAAHYGLTAFNLVAVVILFDSALRWRQVRRIDFFEGAAGLNLRLWLVYGGIAVAGSVVLPHLFKNVPVYLLLQKSSFEHGTSGLHWTVSNLAQAANLALMLLLLFCLRQQRADTKLVKRLLFGFGVALVGSALIGLQQRMAWQGVLPMFESFWASNPVYAQNFVSYAGPIARVSWPFTEPAYGSAWYAAVFGGCLGVFFFGPSGMVALLGMLIAAFALLNSLGATGFMAIASFLIAFGAVFVFTFAKFAPLRWRLGYQLVLGSLVMTCCALAIFLVLRHYNLLVQAKAALSNLLVGANPTIWGDIRPATNWHALAVLRDTFGLGAGLGSNRASSYLASLVSNTGVIGGLAFLIALAHLMVTLLKRLTIAKIDTRAVFLLGALVAGTLSVVIAIPDQNWPVYWVLIISAFAWVSHQQQLPAPASIAPSRVANPAI